MLKNTYKALENTPVSENLKQLLDKPEEGSTQISEIIENFHENGILIALIFFSLPIAVPLPYPPGFTTVVGIPLILLSIQLLLGNSQVKLPLKVSTYDISNKFLHKISSKIIPILVYIERYVKPRTMFARSVYCERLVGFMSLISAFAIALPLPLTNAIPALGITVISLGLLNRDGITIIVGVVIQLIGLAIGALAVLTSWAAVKYLFNFIF
jgi:hypothetical protein